MLSRPPMFAFAMIAALAITGLAPTSASAFADGSVRFSHLGHFSEQRLDPYKNSKYRLSFASGRLSTIAPR